MIENSSYGNEKNSNCSVIDNVVMNIVVMNGMNVSVNDIYWLDGLKGQSTGLFSRFGFVMPTQISLVRILINRFSHPNPTVYQANTTH